MLDLMEIYQITQDKESSLDFLIDIINESNVNPLVDREVLAMEILRQCGAREPRYNTTKTFKLFGIHFFKMTADYINRTLELLAIQYNMLDTYNIARDEKIDRLHTEDLSKVRTDNLNELRTDNLNELRTDNLSELRTDNLSELRTDNLNEVREDSAEKTESNTGSEDGTRNATHTTSESVSDNKTNNYSDEHYVSAENESGVMLRTRDTHAETDGDTKTTTRSVTDAEATHSATVDSHSLLSEESHTTANTGTQTTANTGTQTLANTGTQALANTGTQALANTGTQTTTGDNEFVHDDTIKIGEHGYKTSPNVEFFNALARNEFDIYEKITERFADVMCLGVF